MLYVLKNRHTQIKVSDLGAEMISVIVDGKERLWQNANGAWAGHAPLLFPVCGHFGCKVGGKVYPMPPHGFAKDMLFTAEKQTGSRLVFSLSSSEETKKFYPYDFVYRMEYRLNGKKLTIVHTVENPSGRPLYFACGGHESYLIEKGISDYKLVFPYTETFVHRPHNEEGYLTGARETLGVGNELILPDNYLQNSVTVILENLKSERLRLCENNGTPIADVTFKGFHNLLLWRPENGKVVCIEPWSNLPDEESAWQREFSRKAGVFEVYGGKTKKLKRTIRYY